MKKKYKLLKYACYSGNVCMSVVGNLSPLLFITFRTLYGISYSLLGLLVLVNFSTQLLVDLIFSFFSHRFDIPKTVKTIPVITIVGFVFYAGAPIIFPNHVYLGLVIGTIIFSAACGLSEVLISPVIAAIPSENPDREMSKLHSIYAWGVVFVVIFSTLFLSLFGRESWQWLAVIFTGIPIAGCILFSRSEIPEMETPERVSGAVAFLKRKELWLCFLAIFLGGASECTMAQWSSGYLEQALGIPKVWGDIFGVAMFAVMLGIGRSWYGKYGKNIGKVLFLSAVGATLCYLIAVISPIPIMGLVACAFTGLCVAMLWPGSLIVGAERVPDGGVFLYAMMAAGGDLGASVVPQTVGVLTDYFEQSSFALQMAQNFGLTVEQMSMKMGMSVAILFPLLAIFVYLYIWKTEKVKLLKE